VLIGVERDFDVVRGELPEGDEEGSSAKTEEEGGKRSVRERKRRKNERRVDAPHELDVFVGEKLGDFGDDWDEERVELLLRGSKKGLDQRGSTRRSRERKREERTILAVSESIPSTSPATTTPFEPTAVSGGDGTGVTGFLLSFSS